MIDDADLPPPRKPDCHLYSQCLTLAATHDHRDLGCSRCDRYHPRPLDLADLGAWMPGCGYLVFALFVDADRLGRVPIEHLNQMIFGPRPWAGIPSILTTET